MIPYPRRLAHIVTRADWATLLTSTYAAAQSVDDDEAHDRLTQALGNNELLDELYGSLAKALEAQRGPRTGEEEQLDKLSAAIQKRRGRIKAATVTTALAAALVRINLELGIAPEALRATLTTPKGAALLQTGSTELATHLVNELLK